MSARGHNGYTSWNAWNVSLWLNNDEPLYREMVRCRRNASWADEAPRDLLEYLNEIGITHTPDGAVYNVTGIRQAMQGIDRD